MIDIDKQIEYWSKGALDDFEAARILIEKKKFLRGLFFCHLAIEKILKAHVVKTTGDFAPRSYNLFFLIDQTSLIFEEKHEIFMGILMKYQLQGKYPDNNPFIPDKTTISDYLLQTKILLKCLQQKLSNY